MPTHPHRRRPNVPMRTPISPRMQNSVQLGMNPYCRVACASAAGTALRRASLLDKWDCATLQCKSSSNRANKALLNVPMRSAEHRTLSACRGRVDNRQQTTDNRPTDTRTTAQQTHRHTDTQTHRHTDTQHTTHNTQHTTTRLVLRLISSSAVQSPPWWVAQAAGQQS